MMNHGKEIEMPDSHRDLVQAKAVSMYPTHWAIVHQFAQDQGYGSTSAALRRIVDEWDQIKSARSQLSERIETSETALEAR
jgi:hypothetical protein